MTRDGRDLDHAIRSALADVESGLAGEQPAVGDWAPRVHRRLAVRRARRRGGAVVGALLLMGGLLYAVPSSRGDAETGLVASPPPSASPSVPAPTTEPQATATGPSARPTPAGTPSSNASSSAEPTPVPAPEPPVAPVLTTYEGRVVDVAGRPLAGIQVWSLSVNAISGRPADTVSDADGTFSLPCGTGHKGILASWRLGGRQEPGTRNLAPVFAGGSSDWDGARPLTCRQETTTMRVGAILTGRISQATENGTQPVPDHQQIPDGVSGPDDDDLQGSILARWDPIDDAYRFVGLPSGKVGVSDGGNGSMNDRYAVTAGQVRRLDWVLSCRTCPTPSSEPTPVEH